MENQVDVLIAVSGSIAAYRIADTVSELRKSGISVQCILSPSAKEFVTPLVLETLSGNPVVTSVFGEGISGTEHIRLARNHKLLCLAPATANMIAKISLGLADDLVSTVWLASKANKMVAPAMNWSMWESETTQEHVKRLSSRGVDLLGPETEGELACGELGAGKMIPALTLAHEIKTRLNSISLPQDVSLKGKRILITSGPTISKIDDVRYMTNGSTGKMGKALAEEALSRGAHVDFVTGIDKGVVFPSAPEGSESNLTIIKVQSAEEMLEQAVAKVEKADYVIAASAVLDYKVAAPFSGKEKRTSEPKTLALFPCVDVLASLQSKRMAHQKFLGFAAEAVSEEKDLKSAAERKLKSKNLDFVYANPLSCFSGETSSGLLLSRDGKTITFESSSKRHVAKRLIDLLSKSDAGA